VRASPCASAALLNRGGSILSTGEALHHHRFMNPSREMAFTSKRHRDRSQEREVYTPRCKAQLRSCAGQSSTSRSQSTSDCKNAVDRSELNSKSSGGKVSFPRSPGDNQSERALNHEILQKLWPKSAGCRITRLASRRACSQFGTAVSIGGVDFKAE
jgi:hypothetical protein